MKTIKILIFLALPTLLLTSCRTTSYFQVYKTTTTENLIAKENHLVYKDDNCKVSYNLWDQGGDVGFSFYNKTDNGLYLNLDESFFVVNGVAHDYYRNRVFTNSTNSGSTISNTATASKSMTGFNYFNLLQTNKLQASNSVGLMASSGFSTAFTEDKIIYIPAKTSKLITEYNINNSLYRDCDLYKYPTRSQVRAISFTKNDSPLVFSNRIAYSVGAADELIRFENEFYVTEITNYPENEILESKRPEYCEQKGLTILKYFKNVSPDKFYIQYNKGSDRWKH